MESIGWALGFKLVKYKQGFLFIFCPLPPPHVNSPRVTAKFGHAARPGKLLNQGREYDNYLSITDFQEPPFYSKERTV